MEYPESLKLKNESVENLVISIIFQDTEALARFATRYHQHKGDDWFQGRENRWIASALVYSIDKNPGQIPSVSWLLFYIQKGAERQYPITPNMNESEIEEAKNNRNMRYESYELLIERRLQTKVNPSEIDIWVDQLIQMHRNRQAVSLIQEASEKLTVGDVEGMLDLLFDQSARLRQMTENDAILTSHYFEEIEEDIQEYKNRRDEPDLYKGWYTGITKLDEEINGLRGGEMGIVMGESGGGKTTLIREIGVNAAFQGAKVLFVSAEQRKQLFRDQLNSLLTGVSYKELNTGAFSDEELDERVRRVTQGVRERMKGDMAIVDVPENCSVALVRQIIRERFRQQFDFYVWDHMGRMTPSGTHGETSRYDWKGQGALAEEIIAFTRSEKNSKGEMGVTSWVACQQNREKQKQDDLDTSNISLSYLTVWPAHAIISIYRSQQLINQNEAILKIVKARTGPKFAIRCMTDLSRCKFLSHQYDPDEEVSDQNGIGSF